MKKIAVVLSGCGVYDGTEIHEAVLTMLAIDSNGASFEVFAPDIDQHHVVNHITGGEMDETRNVLTESARIARGSVRALDKFNGREFDAVIFPGGFGAAKNLSTFAFDGTNCQVNSDVEAVIREMVRLGKPVGALCIAPVILAKLLGDVELTIGDDAGTIQAIEEMGATHKETTHGEVVVDKKYKIVTTPCYMLDATITQIEEGAQNVVKAILGML